MAVPGAFAPVHHEGKVLVDGGIVDNLPVDIARQMGVDRLIVVDVGQRSRPRIRSTPASTSFCRW